MSEPRILKLTKIGDFDGSNTEIPLTLNDLVVTGGRVYSGNVGAAGSVVPADFFGLFSKETPKLLGVAFSSENPRSIGRVIDTSDRIREQFNLTQAFQYVMLHPQDRVGFQSFENNAGMTANVEVTLEVNDVTERDHMEWALRHQPAPVHTRLRLVRGTPFIAIPTLPPFLPSFTWDGLNSMLVATDVANGPIPIGHLSQFPRRFGALVTVRYSNSVNDGVVRTVDETTRGDFELQSGMQDGRWSRVFYLAHSDMLVLGASPNPVGGGPIVADIEIVRVEPGDRLRERYGSPEVIPAPLGHNL
jgi:hypothetical protein